MSSCKLKVLDLFSGIGGFSLGLERTGGFETVAFCEIEKYPQKVLAKNWPGVPIYDDVRELTAERLLSDGIAVDVITGGFPCQDISAAGNQAGIGEGTRSGLWSECARLLGDIRPRYAIFENVTALLSGDSGRWFEQVLWDISQVGYDAEWHCIPASELGAHHHRDRVWIIAYPKSCGDTELKQPLSGTDTATQEGARRADKLCGVGGGWEARCRESREGPETCMADTDSERTDEFREGGAICNELGECSQTEHQRDELEHGSGSNSDVADSESQGLQGWEMRRPSRPVLSRLGESGGAIENCWKLEPNVGRVANGIPQRSHRLKALGNAVVPAIPELIGRAILASMNT